jgi:hypothetical protein
VIAAFGNHENITLFAYPTRGQGCEVSWGWPYLYLLSCLV